MKVGQRVRFLMRRDIYPFTIVKEGETGTITALEDIAYVKLDSHHEGLDDFNNEVHMSYLDDQFKDDYPILSEYCELIND